MSRLPNLARLVCSCLALMLLMPAGALADTLYLEDGSVIHGELRHYYKDHWVIQTGFAGELSIPESELIGVGTERSVVAATESKGKTQGKLAYNPESGQRIVDDAGNNRALALDGLSRVHAVGAADPAEVERQANIAKRGKQEAETASLWSGRLSLGIQGSSGNTEEESSNFSGMALRETDQTRLSLEAQLHKASQDGEETEDEFLATTRLERDFTERAFVFGQVEYEQDEFEGIDYRVRATVGPGYFLIKQPGHTLKTRLGLGYLYEQFENGSSESGLVATLGYDYMIVIREFFRFTHDFTIIPEVDNNPGENYRIESVLGGELPLGATGSLWYLRGELRHDYDNNPAPGVEDLDTSYLLSIVRKFE